MKYKLPLSAAQIGSGFKPVENAPDVYAMRGSKVTIGHDSYHFKTLIFIGGHLHDSFNAGVGQTELVGRINSALEHEQANAN